MFAPKLLISFEKTIQQAGDELPEAKFTFLSTHHFLSLCSLFLHFSQLMQEEQASYQQVVAANTFQTFSARKVVQFSQFMHRHAASFSNKQCTLHTCSNTFLYPDALCCELRIQT
jgi:hypothetical protein